MNEKLIGAAEPLRVLDPNSAAADPNETIPAICDLLPWGSELFLLGDGVAVLWGLPERRTPHLVDVERMQEVIDAHVDLIDLDEHGDLFPVRCSESLAAQVLRHALSPSDRPRLLSAESSPMDDVDPCFSESFTPEGLPFEYDAMLTGAEASSELDGILTDLRVRNFVGRDDSAARALGVARIEPSHPSTQSIRRSA